jgi:hypothetical protein
MASPQRVHKSQTADSWMLAQWDSRETWDIESCRTMTLCCFKPLCYSSNRNLILPADDTEEDCGSGCHHG